MKYTNPNIESSYQENDIGKTLYDAVLKYKPLHTQLRRHALDDIKNLTWDNQTKEITHVYNSLYTNIL